MKKLSVGVLLASALLFAPAAFADPCGLCQSYYPCYWACENCVESREGPGLWVDGGGCWGTVEEGTCGDTGQCGWNLSAANQSCAPFLAPAADSQAGAVPASVLLPIAPASR